MKNLVANQLVDYLEDRGVRHIFGLCGHTNIALLSAMEKSAIAFVNVRHEQTAAHAADAGADAPTRVSDARQGLAAAVTAAEAVEGRQDAARLAALGEAARQFRLR